MLSELERELKSLWVLALRGDGVAYEKVLKKLSQLLRGYLQKSINPRFRSVEKVEDLVQEVLFALHRKRDLYDQAQPFLPWVYTIARYKLIDSFRAEKRQPEFVEWLEKFDSLAFVEIPKMFEEQQGDELLQGLNDQQKEVLRLAKVEELPLHEIALQLNMSLSAVKVTVHRSLKFVRRRLGERRWS